jgi:metal-responsive CopG/Arc/MetJ family transcriptional regulator
MNEIPAAPPSAVINEQVTVRMPQWIVSQIDAVAAAEFSTRAAVLRRILAHAIRSQRSAV